MFAHGVAKVIGHLVGNIEVKGNILVLEFSSEDLRLLAKGSASGKEIYAGVKEGGYFTLTVSDQIVKDLISKVYDTVRGERVYPTLGMLGYFNDILAMMKLEALKDLFPSLIDKYEAHSPFDLLLLPSALDELMAEKNLQPKFAFTESGFNATTPISFNLYLGETLARRAVLNLSSSVELKRTSYAETLKLKTVFDFNSLVSFDDEIMPILDEIFTSPKKNVASWTKFLTIPFSFACYGLSDETWTLSFSPEQGTMTIAFLPGEIPSNCSPMYSRAFLGELSQ